MIPRYTREQKDLWVTFRVLEDGTVHVLDIAKLTGSAAWEDPDN